MQQDLCRLHVGWHQAMPTIWQYEQADVKGRAAVMIKELCWSTVSSLRWVE